LDFFVNYKQLNKYFNFFLKKHKAEKGFFIIKNGIIEISVKLFYFYSLLSGNKLMIKKLFKEVKFLLSYYFITNKICSFKIDYRISFENISKTFKTFYIYSF